MSKDRRKKREESKRRYEAIKDLMSTFAMTTVAVVAAVTLIPASPKAEIVKIVSLSEEIVYQVNVTDIDNALDLDSLTVVLENQLEYYEQPAILGEQSGFFEALESNTEYRLSVYGNKGFGQERLATRMVTTTDRVGGTILSVTPDTIGHSTSYYIDVSINDPDSKYTSIVLYYGYPMHPGEDIVYSSINVTQTRETLEILDLFTSEDIHIYLEGTTIEETELLDEITVTPPYTYYASIWNSYISKDAVGFSLYGDMNVEDQRFKMNVYNGDLLVTSKIVSVESDGHGDIELAVDGLSPNTSYRFECTAIYTHPNTLRQTEEVIYEEEITTLETYSYTYTIETIGENLEVTITVNDPSHNFQEAYFVSIDTSGEFDNWLAEESFFFTPVGEEKTTTFTILIPISDSYKITIGIRNEMNHNIKHIIEVIIYE